MWNQIIQKTSWMEEPGGLQSMGSLESDTTKRLHFHFSLSRIGEGNGNPLQCSCLENPRYGEAWWAAVYGVAQSWIRLKQLSSSNVTHWLYDLRQVAETHFPLYKMRISNVYTTSQINCKDQMRLRVKVLIMSDSLQPHGAYQAPLSMEFSR